MSAGGEPAAGPLREPRRFTAAQAAAAAGVSLAQARQYWRALGYGSFDDPTVGFTDSDVDVLRMVTSYVGHGMLEESDSLRLTRILGRSVAHLVQLQMDIVAGRMERGDTGHAEAVRRLANEVMPQAQWLLSAMWRRQMATALERFEQDDTEALTPVLAVGFADIVGFTGLSARRSELDLMRIIEYFEDRATDLVTDRGGVVVKMLGDEVLFTAADPAAAADIATTLVEVFGQHPDIPGLRVGVALGPVLRHLGDIFGTTVNLASRLTRLAEPDRVLVSPELAAQLAVDPDYVLRPLRSRLIRGIGTMAPAELERGRGWTQSAM